MERAYMHVFNDIQKHPIYNKKLFSNYSEFKEFLNNSTVSGFDTNGELKKAILDKICEYHLTHDKKTGEPNKPITYFKFVYTRKN